MKLFLRCRAMIRNEKPSNRKVYQPVSTSLSTNLQEGLQTLMDRAERRIPQNQVTLLDPHSFSFLPLSLSASFLQIESSLFEIPSFTCLHRSMKNTQESHTAPQAQELSSAGDIFISNPKIGKLREILVKHFSSVSAREPHTSRVIVFVAYRATAADLLRELSNTTGQASSHLRHPLPL
jgi:hypothetical protein